ncbi:MAG: sigma-70 family RNA polymerase sigma factor [Phycisphaerae bacterium]|nr:sigma-70 family RNA polymerase sigma factor [Phycisphaerae bacterium]
METGEPRRFIENSQTEIFIRSMAVSYNRIYAFILTMVGNYSDADDLMQEVSAVMWRKFDQFDPETSFYAWGMTIANFEILRFRKKHSRAKVQFNDALYEKALESIFVGDDRADVRVEALQDCRRKLSEKDQKLLKLRYEKDKRPEQIAKATDRSRRSIFRDLSRVHNLLHQCVNRKLMDLGIESLACDISNSSKEVQAQVHGLAVLVAEMLDGSIDPQKFELLQNQLLAEPQQLAYYIEHISLCANLKKYQTINQPVNPSEGNQEHIFCEVVEADLAARTEIELAKQAQPEKEKITYQRSSLSPWTIYRVFGAIAAMIIIALLLTAIQQFGSQVRYREPRKPVVASLSQQIGALWMGDDQFNPGDPMRAGQFELVEGLANIEFRDGAQVVIQAPAQIELITDSEIYLHSGKLVAYVPESAIGFVVRTDNSKIVDLGTEFGVSAINNSDTIVNVFQGEVALSPRDKESNVSYPILKLQAGQGRKVDMAHKVTNVSVDELAFVRGREFNCRYKASQGSDYHRWLAYSYDVRRDPDLVVYYPFDIESEESDILLNVASSTVGRLNGQLAQGKARPDWVQGRWPEKSALKFNRREKQFVTVPADQDFCIADNVTIAAWVKCPDANKFGQIVSNRLDGQVNYQLSVYDPALPEANRMQFLRYDDLFENRIVSSNKLNPSNRWVFLCITHDNNTVNFYVDGHLFETRQYEFETAPVLAELNIGAATVQGHDFSHQMFNGIMDEILIYKRVLTGQDIKAIYEASKP